jgi:hypothetical protein
MPGGALACVLPPRTRHAWPSLEAGHSVRGPACVGSHGATRGSHKGRGHFASERDAEMALASSGRRS